MWPAPTEAGEDVEQAELQWHRMILVKLEWSGENDLSLTVAEIETRKTKATIT